MKRFILHTEKYLFLKSLCIGAVVCVCFLTLSFPACGETGEGNEPVSLAVQDMPLAEVLEKLSQSTGYEFTVSEQWLDYPISASFDSIPLHKALKRMFADLNSAVIYGSDKKIKIIIYDDTSHVQSVSEKPKVRPVSRKKKSQQQAALDPEPSPADSELTESGEESNPIQDALDEYEQSGETPEDDSTESEAEEPSDQDEIAESQAEEPADQDESAESQAGEPSEQDESAESQAGEPLDEEESPDTAESGFSEEGQPEDSERAESGESN